MPELSAEAIVRAALLEDLGRGGDLTSNAIVAEDRAAAARIVARRPGVLAGLDSALLAFALLDARVDARRLVPEGARLAAGSVICTLAGPARAILGGERTCLNLLTHLSGIATTTREFADLVAGTNASIIDTRKTTPGLRALERYAVRCGGGKNHRFGLDDGILIKDNHIALAGSVRAAIAAARAAAGHMVKVEVEVDTLEQLREALDEPVDAVLLDNMSLEELRSAVALVAGRAVTEASGGVTMANVAQIAACGVDLISVGRLTHSAPALDLAVDIDAG